MDPRTHALKPMGRKGNSPQERFLYLFDHDSGSWENSVVREMSCLEILKARIYSAKSGYRALATQKKRSTLEERHVMCKSTSNE
jgi:hypothetical protein